MPMEIDRFTFEIKRELEIAAPAGVVFASVLEELGTENRGPDGVSLRLKIEPWAGGRWYRDMGNGSGHLWGFVQVIKPPTLFEVSGPLFMSYPAMNHVQYRLTEHGKGTTLAFLHRAFGDIAADHRKGMVTGWEVMLARMAERAARGAGKSATT